jgi:hypothetical protein
VHEYPTDTCGTDTVTIPQLLAQSLISGYVNDARRWVAVANQHGLPLELDETNSTACGGQKGVDDVFAATAWGLDWLFTNAGLGMQRINVHMDDAAYSAVHVEAARVPHGVHYQNTVEPIYYAMYAFNHTAEGKRLLPVSVRKTANIKAYAVRACRSCLITVYVINKDLKASGLVTVRTSAVLGRARLLMMRAASLSSHDVTYGRQSFNDTTGQIGPPRTTAVIPDASGAYVFKLPNAAIAILAIQPT